MTTSYLVLPYTLSALGLAASAFIFKRNLVILPSTLHLVIETHKLALYSALLTIAYKIFFKGTYDLLAVNNAKHKLLITLDLVRVVLLTSITCRLYNGN